MANVAILIDADNVSPGWIEVLAGQNGRGGVAIRFKPSHSGKKSK